MNIIYIFYISYKEEHLQYNADEWTKEEMENDIIYDKYPQREYCMREKWINGVRDYKNSFKLEARRQNPNYISKYREEEIFNNCIIGQELETYQG